MSTTLIDLNNRIITDTGSVVAKPNLLKKMLLDGKNIDEVPFVKDQDVIKYHVENGTTELAKMWIDDKNFKGPNNETYQWTYPDEYRDIDIDEKCVDGLERVDFDEKYVSRLAEELTIVHDRRMEDFIRCVIWVFDTLRNNNITVGLGRGSSCASLVLFLLGITKVDPVKYDIPMEEFYK